MRAWWIPLHVARTTAFEPTAPRPVFDDYWVYTGPFSKLAGHLWRALGHATEEC